MTITDSISSLGSSITDTVSGIVHDVSTRAPELAHTVADAGQDVAKEAVGLGRHGLEAIGLVDRRRHGPPTIVKLLLIAVIALGIAQVVRRRRSPASGHANTSGHNAAHLRDAAVA